ncbi:dCTP deaminase [Candidatus Gracilibacteria bacterium]|nr:MAG: dCTP deaminase [Candidatus Gracilibacteria bacterium]
MILSDSKIKSKLESGDLVVESLIGKDIFEQIGPASLDFRLGNTFKVYRKSRQTVIDAFEGVDSKHIETITLEVGEKFVLHPGDFVLGVTAEKIKIPYDLVARCEGRSSIGRLGVIIHSTAGFIDPGFEGTITLEMTNINELPVALYVGMRIGQFAFEKIDGVVENPYDKRVGSKYMGQILPEESRIGNDLY